MFAQKKKIQPLDKMLSQKFTEFSKTKVVETGQKKPSTIILKNHGIKTRSLRVVELKIRKNFSVFGSINRHFLRWLVFVTESLL